MTKPKLYDVIFRFWVTGELRASIEAAARLREITASAFAREVLARAAQEKTDETTKQ